MFGDEGDGRVELQGSTRQLQEFMEMLFLLTVMIVLWLYKRRNLSNYNAVYQISVIPQSSCFLKVHKGIKVGKNLFLKFDIHFQEIQVERKPSNENVAELYDPAGSRFLVIQAVNGGWKQHS